jgi:hypothetical protein
LVQVQVAQPATELEAEVVAQYDGNPTLTLDQAKYCISLWAKVAQAPCQLDTELQEEIRL